MNRTNVNSLLRRLTAATLLVAAFVSIKAQPITIPIETKQNAMVLEVTPEKYLEMVYFGESDKIKNEYQGIAKK